MIKELVEEDKKRLTLILNRLERGAFVGSARLELSNKEKYLLASCSIPLYNNYVTLKVLLDEYRQEIQKIRQENNV